MKLIVKKEACHRVGVSRATIDRWRGQPGKPQPVKQGTRVYYVENEIDEYIHKLSSLRESARLLL